MTPPLKNPGYAPDLRTTCGLVICAECDLLRSKYPTLSEPVFGAGSADFMPVKRKGGGGVHIV